VLEYKTTKLYPSSKREQFEAEHTLNDEPYYGSKGANTPGMAVFGCHPEVMVHVP